MAGTILGNIVNSTLVITSSDLGVVNGVATLNASGQVVQAPAPNTVTNAGLSQVATQTFKGRTTAGTGNVEDLTVSQAKTLLGAGASNGLATLNASGKLPTNQLSWQPPVLPLGSVLVSGATFFINGGAGVYLSFDGASDDKLFFNYSLQGANGVAYDGSNLAVKLHGRLSTNGGAGDTVGFVVDYGIVKNGDNSSTTSTTLAQQDVNVSSHNQDIEFDITLGTMTGVVGGHNLLFTLTRNSLGAGSDTYSGDFELTGIEIIKV